MDKEVKAQGYLEISRFSLDQPLKIIWSCRLIQKLVGRNMKEKLYAKLVKPC